MATEGPEVMSVEQRADLAALQGMAGEEGASLAQQQEIESQQAEATAAQKWAMVPAMFGGTLAMAFPDLAKVYSPVACEEWGKAMAPYAAEKGWDVDEVMGPGMALAMASGPLVIGTFVVIRNDLENRKKPEKDAVQKQEGAARQVPGAAVDKGGMLQPMSVTQ